MECQTTVNDLDFYKGFKNKNLKICLYFFENSSHLKKVIKDEKAFFDLEKTINNYYSKINNNIYKDDSPEILYFSKDLEEKIKLIPIRYLDNKDDKLEIFIAILQLNPLDPNYWD